MIEFAKWQLDKLTEKCKDKDSKIMQNMMNNDVLELLKVFSEQGHSGFSASIATRLFYKLANHKLVTEVEDNPNDWNEYGQHKYISSILKEKMVHAISYMANCLLNQAVTGSFVVNLQTLTLLFLLSHMI